MASANADSPATQSQLRETGDRLDKKIDGLDKKLDRIAMEYVMMRENMATKEDLKSVQTDVRNMTQTLDSFLGKFDTYSRESVIIPKTLDGHGKILKDHERWIQVLETK